MSSPGHSAADAARPLTDAQLVAAAETVAQQVAQATREGPASEALDRALMVLDQLKPPDAVVRLAFLRSMKPRWQKRMGPVLEQLEGLQLQFGIALGASYWAQGFEFGFKEGSKR